ncbi:glycosyltransferase family 4 protein [Clostridium intestinale]|jgi:glycosyltransferase involved in cell wall biosynthesis|uniref:Glycosyltransferase family 4 protein n=1 Tax=Clostridium intestinale TaxID=36845 RepID=A0A7D7A2Y8_9CLOT|nr:glycosyltransferase family 1 protein [Clostridium intestinale]QLY79260.1 glycosyltransferase family 4 protein [Clostridium intestinale]
MHIGIDGRAAKWYRGTGIGTYTYQLIYNLNLVDKINDYSLFLPNNSNLDNLNSNFKFINTVHDTQENFWEEVSLPNILKDENLDIYHVPQNGVGLPNHLDSSSIITLHDIIPLRMPETVSDRYLRIFNNDMKKIIDGVQGIITVSNFSKDDISKEFNYPKDKIFVTHLAAENIYKPMDKIKCKKFLRSNYSIDSNFMLYVGGFSPRKNITGLIEAFSLLKGIYTQDLKLVIVGKQGISYEKYKNRTIELGIEDQVIFPGFIPLEHMPVFYNACETLVYPSFYEGFGLPPLEAMACGTPVIASNCTSIPEILGNSALLINPKDVYEIMNAMYSILTNIDLKIKLTVEGIERNKIYNWNKTALDTLSAYKFINKIR